MPPLEPPVWETDPELQAEAEAERERHRAARLELADARPPEFSDEALALRFAEKHAGTTRYVADWGKWLLWIDGRWKIDATLHAFHLARVLARTEAAGADKPKIATSIASAKTVAAIVSLARADRRIAATTDQWDADLWLLTTRDSNDGN